jgi:hypothetical protein
LNDFFSQTSFESAYEREKNVEDMKRKYMRVKGENR